MINTVETKKQQLQIGYYKIGNGAETIFIMGSCRAVPYITYLNDWNKIHNRFSIYFIDPFNWNWNLKDERVDYEKTLSGLESNQNILELFKNTDIFIHEYYSNAGMFNVDKSNEKDIYSFGMNPKIDITLPNFNDILLLSREIVSFDMDIRKLAIQDFNVLGKLSHETEIKILDVKRKNLHRFFDICSKTSFPEFAEIFNNEYRDTRFFWTFNHVTKLYTQKLFKMMNDKYLNLDLAGYRICEIDMLEHHYTKLSEYDTEYNWNELKSPLRNAF